MAIARSQPNAVDFPLNVAAEGGEVDLAEVAAEVGISYIISVIFLSDSQYTKTSAFYCMM